MHYAKRGDFMLDENKNNGPGKEGSILETKGNLENDEKTFDPDKFVKSFRDLIGKEDFKDFLINTDLDSPEFEESIKNFFTFAKKYYENFPDISQIDIDKLREAFKRAKESILEYKGLEEIELEGYTRE